METTIPMMSATIGKITAALSKFQGEVKQPTFNKKVRVNNNYNFEYADLSACVAAASPVLQANGLAVVQTLQGGILVTTLMHTSGEYINSFMPYDLSRFTKMQELGSALTYAKRYAYCAILGLVADADDDANMADGNTAVFQQRGQVQTPFPPQQPAAPRSGVTGAQLKGYIMDVAKYNDIESLINFAKALPAEVRKNEQFISTMFQRASSFAITALASCDNEDEVQMLIDDWNLIYPQVTKEKTPFGNAVKSKLATFKEAKK